MKYLLDLGNRYAKASTWLDFALVKFCLCAMGVIIGVLLPLSAKKAALIIAIIVFVITYIPLMYKLLKIAKNK
ncbi:MAG: hypothetical protein Q4B60_05095 [Erysipelotrichaceae bacterium]|nr:hypothetical protein [Erysipelotrichaceae bacterium]